MQQSDASNQNIKTIKIYKVQKSGHKDLKYERISVGAQTIKNKENIIQG